MKHRFLSVLAFFSSIAILCGSCSSRPEYPFLDTSLSIEERVDDLVGRLTLEEKVAQMSSAAPAIERLGIPAYDWQNECLHGVGKIADYKVTVFPQPIGLAATWDEEGVQKVADCIAEEGRAVYHEALRNDNHAAYYGLTYWAPNINIFRDPRWGRGHETFGEDPYLTGHLGCAYVKGLQGDDPKYLKASACAKHYAVHSGPEGTRHEFNAEVSDDDLWNTYLPAFRDVVEKADVSGIMCAYNAVDGRPCCGNDLLMMGILRDDWGFKGYVTSDCGAIDDFYKGHRTHPDTISAAADAVVHGTDLDCIRDNTFKTLVEAVRLGEMEESDIDRAVKRLFTIRFRLGMFDPDKEVKYASVPLSSLDNPFTDYAMKNRTYRYFKGKPLYPFGYGLSYTTFGYDNIKIDGETTTSSVFTVSAEVANLGCVSGDEVVQLYISREGDSDDEPIRSLKGFKRIHLNPGEKKTVSFTLAPEDLAYYRLGEGRRVIPGSLKVSIGGGQPGTIAPCVSSIVSLEGENYKLSN